MGKLDYVIIDHDPKGMPEFKLQDYRQRPGYPVPEIVLQCVGYRDDKVVASLSSIDFYRNDDWEVGKFTDCNQISCEHLREVAENMGLPNSGNEEWAHFNRDPAEWKHTAMKAMRLKR